MQQDIPTFTQNPLNNLEDQKFTSFSEKIIAQCENIDPTKILAPYLMRKYISYVKKNITPSLSKEAADVIKSFYLHLR